MGKFTKFYTLLIPWLSSVWFFIALCITGTLSSRCQIDNIKRGFSLKRGLNQDNILRFGQANDLDACNRLCCKNTSINVGLYDGIQCYGLVCKGEHDKRCNLLSDGNADYTIFKIVRKGFQPDDNVDTVKTSHKLHKRPHAIQISHQTSSKEKKSKKKTSNILTKKTNNKVKHHVSNKSTIVNASTAESDLQSIGNQTVLIFQLNKNSTKTSSDNHYNKKKKTRRLKKKRRRKNQQYAKHNSIINQTIANQSISSVVTYSPYTFKNLTITLKNSSWPSLKYDGSVSSKSNSSNILNVSHTLRTTHEFHRKHKKRRKTKKKKSHKKLSEKTKTRVSRDYPYLYSNSYQPSLLNTAGAVLKRAGFPTLASKSYIELMKANAEDQALINRLMSDRSKIQIPNIYNQISPQNSITTKGLPLQSVLNFAGNSAGDSNVNNAGLSQRLDENGHPLTMPMFYPQEKTKLDIYSNMQRNMLANLPTMSGIEKGKEMIDPNLFLSDVKQQQYQAPMLPQKSFYSKPINPKTVSVPQQPSPLPPQKQKVSTSVKTATVLPKKQPAVYHNSSISPSKQNIKTPATQKKTIVPSSTFSTPSKINSSISVKKDFIPRAEIQSLKEFPTDKDVYQVEQKDTIPRPDVFDATQDILVGRDEIDVPFTTNMQLPKSTSLPQGLLSYPSYIKQHYIADSQQHKQQPNIISNIYKSLTTQQQQQQQKSLQQFPTTPTTSNHQNIYSLMYPLSTIQRKTYQRLLLESKAQQQEPKDSDIEIVDVSPQQYNEKSKQKQLKYSISPQNIDNADVYFAQNEQSKQKQLKYLNSFILPTKSNIENVEKIKNQNDSINIPLYPTSLTETQKEIFLNTSFLSNNSSVKYNNNNISIQNNTNLTTTFQNKMLKKSDVEKPSSEDVRTAIHEIDELKEQVENLLTFDPSDTQYENTSKINATQPFLSNKTLQDAGILRENKINTTRHMSFNKTTQPKTAIQANKINTTKRVSFKKTNQTEKAMQGSKINTTRSIITNKTTPVYHTIQTNNTSFLSYNGSFFNNTSHNYRNSSSVISPILKTKSIENQTHFKYFHTPVKYNKTILNMSQHLSKQLNQQSLKTKFIPPIKSSHQVPLITHNPSNIQAMLNNLSRLPLKTPMKSRKYINTSTLGCNNPVGISKPFVITDDHMRASSVEDGYPATRGRLRIKENGESDNRPLFRPLHHMTFLHLCDDPLEKRHDSRRWRQRSDYVGSWCASRKSSKTGKTQFLQSDIGDRKMFCRVAIQGDERQKKWVKKFRLHFSDNGRYWEPYREDGKIKLFVGNEDEKDITYRTLKNPIMSRFIRFEPVSWKGDSPCMRVEVFNTSITRGGLIRTTSRSDIPKEHVGLILDLDFEKMDDAIALDRSSFGNNGFLAGGAKVFESHSSCRHAVKLPPGADIVIDGSIMKNRPREAITVASWVQLDKVDGVHSLFDTVGEHSKHDLGQFHFEIVGGDVRWFHRNESEDIIFNVITEKKLIRPNDWNYIAATYESSTGDAIIYVNGTERVRGKGKGLISKDWNQRVGIGRHKGVRFLDGAIDNFQIYDIALDPKKIIDLAEKCDYDKYYCGSTLTLPSGTIVSPTYPDTIKGPVQCVWDIEGKFDEVIVLDMKQLKLGNGKGDCGKATLEVRDTENDTLIGSYCGSQNPRKVTSHSNRMYLKYYTDGALPGERFKVEYRREKKLTSKKTLENHCKASPTMKNVTLVGGAKAGTFTDLGYSEDMEECKKRCCNNDNCEVAFMIDDNCYAVKCANDELCKVRKAKPSSLNPMVSFMGRGGDESVPPVIPEVDDSETTPAIDKPKVCSHNDILQNSTLVGGIRAGNFTSHGLVDNFDQCLEHCCSSDNCDAAFMVKRTCFSLKCTSKKLCATRKAKPSPYHPVVAFLDRYKPKPKVDKTGETKEILPSASSSSTTASCKDNRVSKIYNDVTLRGGISSGDFTDKGHVTDINECVGKCCESDTCNVAFVIKDTCFLVKCKSYDECGLKSAVSEYYSPKIAYVNWNPPKDNIGDLPYNYKGCWRDFDITAFALPLLEGTDPKLIDAYKKRSDPVNDCASVAQSKGYKVFAIQNGGACFSGSKAEETYKRYGKSEACKSGKGGPFANSVYKSFEDGSVIALGCWADLQDRAFRRMEKNDDLLKSSFESRSDPIGTCSKVAEKLKMNYFALQKGGQCFVAKEQDAQYQKYSPSRKCKYGLGGQMANDVYMLKKNFTVESGQNRELPNKTVPVIQPNIITPIAALDQVHDDEVVYKEEIDGSDLVRYVYKAGEPISNVTLASAINAGSFEDKGKVDSIGECVKTCGENKDCNVAFLLSSQCFNVHCFSDDTCNTKPAYSTFYKPELAFIKHRVIKRPRSQNGTSSSDKPSDASSKSECKPISELENMTFINGISAGNFSDMGHVDNMDECKTRCCHDDTCHVAFKIQSDCYGVRCYNKESCKTRPAKNADLFKPQLAQIRAVKNSADLALEKNAESRTTPPMSTTTTSLPVATTTESQQAANNSSPSITAVQKTPLVTTGISRSPTPPSNKCTPDDWDQNIISNETLVGGINAGDFRDHGQAESMSECMGYCCDEKDCDLSFMIDKDCYTVKCYKPSLCKTRIAKPTTFVPQIAFRKASKIVIDKSNLTELLQLRGKPTPENDTTELAYAAFKSVLLALPDSYNKSIIKSNENTTTNKILQQFPELFQNFLNGINDAIDFVQDTVTELTTDKEGLEKPFNILYKGLSTPPTTPTTQATHIASTHKTRTVIPRPIEGTTPSAIVSSKPSSSGAQATPSFGDPIKHSCKAEPIIYNATLRLGMHSGLFTKLGRVKTMDDCIERCCLSSNADVAYMLGPFCFAVKCKTREMCRPSPAMYSDITSLNLNPAISFLNKDSVPSISPVEEDILDKIFNQSLDSDDLIKHVIDNLTHDTTFSQQKQDFQQKSQQKAIVVSDHDNGQDNEPSTYDVTVTYTDHNETTTTNPLSKTKISSKGFNRGLGSSGTEGSCPDSPITYNVTLRGGVHSGKFTELGQGITMRDCVGKCCDTPLCDVAFMFSNKCYAVGCYDEAQCQAVIAKPSALSPKLAYVTKYRANNVASLDDMPTGVGFAQTSDTCSANRVKHGPIYTNRTLFGGMKAGNFSYLGHAKDIQSCLSKCCEADKCDMAYLVNKQQCFSVKCYSPELCQIADQPFTSKSIEISKLVRPKKRRKLKRSVVIAYLAAGLLGITATLTGITWLALMIVKRKHPKCASQKNVDDDDDEPKPDR